MQQVMDIGVFCYYIINYYLYENFAIEICVTEIETLYFTGPFVTSNNW